METPEFLLVHGAWHGSWCWDLLRTHLPRAHVVDLPSSGRGGTFADDVAVVEGATSAIGGNVVLCAHSYGGAVASEAARHPSVAGVVFVCGFALVPGESMLRNATRSVALDAPAVVMSRAIRMSDDRSVSTVDPSLAVAALYGDCPEPLATDAVGRLVPQSMDATRTPVTSNVWQTKPSTYVVCRHDQALQPEVQREFARRCDRVVELDTGHSPMLSAPDQLAVALDAAAAGNRSSP